MYSFYVGYKNIFKRVVISEYTSDADAYNLIYELFKNNFSFFTKLKLFINHKMLCLNIHSNSIIVLQPTNNLVKRLLKNNEHYTII